MTQNNRSCVVGGPCAYKKAQESIIGTHIEQFYGKRRSKTSSRVSLAPFTPFFWFLLTTQSFWQDLSRAGNMQAAATKETIIDLDQHHESCL